MLLLLVPGAALAADGDNEEPGLPPEGEVVRAPMTIIGFKEDVARRNGYEVIERGGEVTGVRPQASSEDDELNAPEDTVSGNCGSSWYYISGGNNVYYHYTGFNVNRTAVSYSWHVDMDGPSSYNRQWYWGGGLALRTSWSSGTRSAAVDDSGWYAGDVIGPSSFAILSNGGVCYSGGPGDRAYVN